MNTLISFAPLTGFAIIVYIIYRNIKGGTAKTFTINSHQDDNNNYEGGELFGEKWFEVIFPPYLIIYLIVKLVKWYKGLNPKNNNSFSEAFPDDPVFSGDNILNPSYPCPGLNIFTDHDD